MVDSDLRDFSAYLAQAATLYPGFSLPTASTRAYFDYLKRYSLPSVKTAIRKAIDQYPERMPNASVIREIAEVEEKAAHARRNDPPRTPASHQLGEARWTSVPKTLHGQQEYVKAAGNPYETLARIWECESVRRGDHPNGEIPREEGMKRMKQLQRLVAGVAAKMDVGHP